MAWQQLDDQLIGCVLALSAVVAYLLGVLPRFGPRHGIALTALIVVLLLAAAAIATPRAGRLLVLAAAVFTAAHLGWVFGCRSRSPRAQVELQSKQPEQLEQPAPVDAGVADRAMLGRYRIDRELGRGSMGAVYLGHDPQIGRPVAIKTLALTREFEGTALAEARERFFREAETAGRLQHPDIVTIFDAGEEHDLAYIAMEFVKGRDLLPYTVPGRLLPPKQVVGIAVRVAEALAHAHRQGVVHRDIKPANVMIDTEAGTLKVTDFGIARVADASRTRTGMVLGTPSFMSPEQMAGLRVDGRSDLYSLGVMLFQLLTGALPHQSESMARLMYQIANDAAPDIRTLRPELPAALAEAVAKALEKRPEMRYADGRQLADDLRAVLPLL